jgi:hypothetical protein
MAANGDDRQVGRGELVSLNGRCPPKNIWPFSCHKTLVLGHNSVRGISVRAEGNKTSL